MDMHIFKRRQHQKSFCIDRINTVAVGTYIFDFAVCYLNGKKTGLCCGYIAITIVLKSGFQQHVFQRVTFFALVAAQKCLMNRIMLIFCK
ncbi:hypothetical protein D3C73_361620 [compost metagenome]